MAPLKILIVGCGIAGSTLASFLLLSDTLPVSEKPHITILERAPAQRSQGQNIDIRGAGLTIIRKLGLERAIRASTTGEDGVQWVDEHNSIWATIDADRSGKTSTPTADIEILRGRLAELCYLRCKSISAQVQRAGGAGVQFVFGDRLDSIEQSSNTAVTVHFVKSGKTQTYDLVVGADGLQSSTRRLAWGASGDADRCLHKLDAYGGFFSIPKEKAIDNSYRQWFHAAGRRNIMLRPDKQHDRTTVFMFVVNDADARLREVAEQGRVGGLDAQKDLLEEYFRGSGWQTERVLREMRKTDDFYYDMVAQVRMERWSKGRVVLLGDAGYCASPFSGMGTTLAMSGAYNLAGALLDHQDNPEAAFEQYEAEMRPVVTRAQKLFPGMPYTLAPETPWGVWALNVFAYLLSSSGLPKIMFKYLGPPASTVPVREYGFKTLEEWMPEGEEVR